MSFLGILRAHTSNDNIFQVWKDVFTDSNFWRYLLFAFICIGMKMIFYMLSLIIPKVVTRAYGKDALYGVLISILPVFIVTFLILTSPCTVRLDPYSQIVMGAFFNTLAPIAMLFGVSYFHIFIFIILLALGESLYAPKIYEFLFFFAKKGREGMFLALTSAPTYLTMAVSGYSSGVLLDNFFPEEGTRRPNYIWTTMVCCSGLSLILQVTLRRCFKHHNKDYNETTKE